MKKMFLAAALLAAASVAKGQDTVHGLYTGRDYFYSDTIDAKQELRYSVLSGVDYYVGGVHARYFNCGPDTLKVVGAAVPLATMLDVFGIPTDPEDPTHWYYQYHHTDDTSLENCYEYVGIYKRAGDTVSIQTLETFTSLFPNPALRRTAVFSSLDLEAVHVYSTAGTEVLRKEQIGWQDALPAPLIPPPYKKKSSKNFMHSKKGCIFAAQTTN